MYSEMQIKTFNANLISDTKTAPAFALALASSSTANTLSLLTCLCTNNTTAQKQINCNMLLKLNTINADNNSNRSRNDTNNETINDSNNYTDITCNNHCCGCISSESSCLASPSCFVVSTTACCRCHRRRHSNCCLMSPSSSSESTKDNSNYIQHCATNCGDIVVAAAAGSIFNIMYCTTFANNDNKSNNISNNYHYNNKDYNVDNRHCSGKSISSSSSNNSVDSFEACNSFQRTNYNSNTSLYGLIKFAIILIFLTICDSSQAALNNVNLFIEPPAVRRSQSVTLHCQYSLGAPLYSVKFYRGQLEFFRYTPGENQTTKVFHYPGIRVDESVSNATQVVIRNVNFGLSGNFSCEVTADAPLFSTATAYAQMQVVEFPDKRPQLLTEHTRYEPGDVLRANCSTPPSRPRAELRFTINNIPVSSEETQYIKTVDNLIASRLSLNLQLQAVYFAAAAGAGNSNSHMMNALSPGGTVGNPTTYIGGSGASGGALLLRCTAQIGDLYQEYKEIELGTPQKDPVPARVTSSGGGFRGFLETYFGPSSAANSNIKQLHHTGLVTGYIIMILFVTLCNRR